jgi:hypothetical protein
VEECDSHREAAVWLSVEGRQQRRLGPLVCREDAEKPPTERHSVSCTAVRTSDFGCMSRDMAGGSSRPLTDSWRYRDAAADCTDCLHQSGSLVCRSGVP